ncbi:MAG TPA: hypothetical protein DSN98_08505 [Thermoplasmata archaeon]|jgi:hypothetical protein|nr:MAG TPA: hypothetical protein DSN98_08505 [Thermoplasmata archaeon]
MQSASTTIDWQMLKQQKNLQSRIRIESEKYPGLIVDEEIYASDFEVVYPQDETDNDEGEL